MCDIIIIAYSMINMIILFLLGGKKMISRKTGLLVANIVSNSFVHEVRESYNSGRNYKYVQRVNADKLRDFLFEYGARGY